MTEQTASWQKTGWVPNQAMVSARLQAHIAAHLTAAPAKLFSIEEPGFGHLALRWSEEDREFSTGDLQGPIGMMALHLESMHISISPTNRDGVALTLHGKTLDEAKAAIDHFVMIGTREGRIPILPNPKKWPKHPVAKGKQFDCSERRAFAELARHFNNAAIALNAMVLKRQQDGAWMVPRTWLHQFDMAALVSLDPGRELDSARTINIGFSPGDGQFSGPYWYVVPNPEPNPAEVLPLPGGGFWHHKYWTAAILETSTYAIVESPEGQCAHVLQFLDTAYDACLKILEDRSPG